MRADSTKNNLFAHKGGAGGGSPWIFSFGGKRKAEKCIARCGESFCLPQACRDAPLGQRQGGVFRLPPPYLWTPLSPQRVKGCSPLTNPRRKSKPKNASRCAKRIFLCFSHLRLRRRFHVSAGRYRQQRGNTSCEAASRRNEKKAFSEAASFFPFRPLLRGLKGASSPFLVDPARRNRWCFSGSLLARKRELSPA